VRFGKDYKNKRRITIEPTEKGAEPVEYLIPKGKHIHLQGGDAIEKGEYIVEGNPAPHDILAIKGVEELANFLVNEIQEVYRLQGVAINDKHIEVIVRQMLQKVEVTDAGETELIAGEQMDKIELDELNARMKEEGKKPAKGHPVLLGITKASLQTRSFISAASFQETTRVLTEAAVNGKHDTLEGLKENVIVGRLIPAGTGASMAKIREVAVKRDKMILDEPSGIWSERCIPRKESGGLISLNQIHIGGTSPSIHSVPISFMHRRGGVNSYVAYLGCIIWRDWNRVTVTLLAKPFGDSGRSKQRNVMRKCVQRIKGQVIRVRVG